MTELGNIFQPTPAGDKGPDLYVTLRVPTPVDGQPTRVHVPLTLPHAGQRVARADPHGEGEHIALGIPPGLAPGTTLRLRGAGGLPERGGGAAGDLYITIEGFEAKDALATRAGSAPSRFMWPALALVVVTGLLLALWLMQR